MNEVRVTYPHRSAVLSDAWRRLFAGAVHEIGVLVYSGLFLAEDTAVLRRLRDKARAGVRVPIAPGHPEGRNDGRPRADQPIGGGVTGRVRKTLILYPPPAGGRRGGPP